MAERKWQAVDGSTRIKAYEYDVFSRTMYLKFQPGKGGECDVFAYANVTPEMVQDFAGAPSKGRWVRAEIDAKRNEHPYQRIGREAAEENTAV